MPPGSKAEFLSPSFLLIVKGLPIPMGCEQNAGKAQRQYGLCTNVAFIVITTAAHRPFPPELN